MLNELFNGLLEFFIGVINFLLSPINEFILNNIPDLQDLINVLGEFFTSLNNEFLPWFKDSLLLPQWFISFICSYIIMKLLAPMVFNAAKLVIKYWEALV